MRYEAFHYDMDGVIVNSEPIHVESEKDTCRYYGLDIDYATWDGFKGRTAEDIFKYLHAQHVEKHGADEIPSVAELIAHKTNAFIGLVEDGAIQPIEGAMDLIKWTNRCADGKQSLVTSSNELVMKAILRQFALEKFFPVTVSGNDIRIGKPHPGPYLKALRKTEAKATKSLVFEDSKNGIRSALGARCAVMAITSSYHDSEDLSKVNPTYIVDRWCDAPAIIRAAG